jgi:Zn-dependent protease
MAAARDFRMFFFAEARFGKTGSPKNHCDVAPNFAATKAQVKLSNASRSANFKRKSSFQKLDKSFEQFILVAPVLLFSMVAHEYAHGYAALKQGDATAYALGRLTWNPIPHIDLFMTILLPLITYFTAGIAFGGAKPVPVDPRNYRNFKRGDIIVSLAGVTVNFIIAICCVPLIVVLGLMGRGAPILSDTAAILQAMLLYGVLINLALAAFNLIPIPPLDGSHVFKYILPPAWALNYQRLGAQGLLLLFLLISLGSPILNIWFTPVFVLSRLATRAVFPYILPSPWTM